MAGKGKSKNRHSNGMGQPKAREGNQTVNLLGIVEFLHEHLTRSLCNGVFKRTRSKERERKWTLFALSRFWTAVIIRAPQSLTQALAEAVNGKDRLMPKVGASPEAFFKKAKNTQWTFFHRLYQAFIQSILPDAPKVYGAALGSLWERFPEIWIVDGSKLDAIAKRLKILWKEKGVILPGCLTAFYDLSRGITRELIFSQDAAAHELPRAEGALSHMPRGTLLLGDRLYALPEFFRKLSELGHWGLFRRKKGIKIKTIEVLSRKQGSRTFLEDSLVEAGSGQGGAKVQLRLVRFRRGRIKRDLVTSVLDPKLLTAKEALMLYPYRWKIERLFFDLKEVLNLHSFYGANPNAVAMQAYAAAIVHSAFRVAQARIAQEQGVSPEAISPAKLFPKLAVASDAVAVAGLLREEYRRLNPGTSLVEPDLGRMKFARTTLKAILVEKRKGKRKKRKFHPMNRRWRSLAHVSGFQN